MPAGDNLELTHTALTWDAARLISSGYQLVEVTPFDLFPQTYHTESISIFEKP